MNTLKEFNWKSVQKYVEVRPGAFSFYWLYYADGTSVEADKKPLIIWIQGGPGLAASGIANFAEIGPLDMDMQPRNHTWVNFESIFQKINLCFEHNTPDCVRGEFEVRYGSNNRALYCHTSYFVSLISSLCEDLKLLNFLANVR